MGFEPTSLIKYQRSSIELGGFIRYIYRLLKSSDPSTNLFNPSYHPPTNTPAPGIDDIMPGCVAYDVGNATHPAMSAVDAGHEPAVQC